MSTVWVLTEEYNQYDQYGEYFLEVYKEKPSVEQCKKILINHGIISDYQCEDYQKKIALHLHQGGGRISTEDKWLYLREEKLK